MAGQRIFNLGNWQNLDVDTMTNLFLYGELGTPINYCDRIRPADAPDIVVRLDMGAFMTDGPGRYALAALAPFVRNFFGAQTFGLQGAYTVAQLRATLQLSDAEFNNQFGISFQHYAMDTGSGDYASRAYIYNSSGFRISDDTIFVFDGDNSHIENLKIRAFDDNFDFQSSSWVANLANLVLQPAIDPYNLGRTVQIEIRGQVVPVIPTYERSNFIADFDYYNSNYNPISSLISGLSSAQAVINGLKADGVIEYDKNGVPIIYGSARDDTLSINPELGPNAIIIGGPGNDTITGGNSDDSFKGSAGDDVLNGRLGNDYLDGCEGTDTAIFDDGISARIELRSGGSAPSDPGLQPDIGAPFFTIVRGDETDVLHSIEKIRLSRQADTLRIAPDTDFTGMTEVDADGQASGTLDILDFSQWNQSISVTDGKLDGFATEFKNFEAIIGSAFGDTMKGGAADDKFKGSAGDDTLKGDAGNDYLDGGKDTDTALYDDPRGPLDLSSGGVAPRGLEPDEGDTAPFFTVKRGEESDVLHSIEKIRLSDRADTLKIGANTDFAGLKEIDARAEDGGTRDKLDFSQFGTAVHFADQKIDGLETEFKGFEEIIGTARRDTVEFKSGDPTLTFDGGPDKDTVDYSKFDKPLSVDLTQMDQQKLATEGIQITRPADGAPNNNGPAIDYLKNIETLILTNKVDKLEVGRDALKLDLTIDMGESGRQEDFIGNVDTYDLSAVDQAITYRSGKVAVGQLKTLKSIAGLHENLIVKNADKIVLTSHDDVFMSGDVGNIIYTGDGHDNVWISNNVGIADLSPDDRLTIAGALKLFGGLRYMWSESPWAKSWGGLVKWGINHEGELVVDVKGLGTTYVLNWGDSSSMPFEQRPGHISLFEFDIGAYRLLDPNKPSNMTQMGTWDLFGAILKTHFGVQAWKRIDPLTLDLDNDGIELNPQSSISPRFDIDGDLYAERTAWVRPDDGILVRDLNGNGTIDDVSEMFGGRSSGFAALSTLDGNHDGKVDAADNGLADFNGDGQIDENDTVAALKVWRDLDEDAVTDPGELFSLEQLGIASISLASTAQDHVFVNGSQITATGAFTRTDGTTGTIADVSYQVDNINTRYIGPAIEITAQAALLPEHKGYGTLLSLRQAMSRDPGFAITVENTLPQLGSLDLATLRHAALPILTGWALASPVQGDAVLNTHRDVHLLVDHDAFGKEEVIDYAYETSATVVDEHGHTSVVHYWALASGGAVKDAQGNNIEHPSLEQVLASPQPHGGWTILEGAMIGFVERYIGETLPVDRDMPEGTHNLSSTLSVFDSIINTVDLAVVRIVTQGGPLAPFFAGIAYDPEANNFHAATDRELIPVFQAIFDTAQSSHLGAAWVGEWKPLLDVVIGDYVRGGAYLLNTYGFLAQEIVGAYENSGLSLDFHSVTTALGIPADVVVTGSGTLTGSDDADIFYAGSSDDVFRGGKGPDTYVFGHAIGHDVIDDVEPPLGSHVPDTIRFAQLAATDFTATRTGLDLILTVNATGETVTVVRQFEGQQPGLFGGDLSDDTGVGEIIFADGTVWDSVDIAQAVSHPLASDDTLNGTPSIDFLDGGAGNDVLSGGDDSDYYAFGRGYGHDSIRDAQTNILVDGPDFLQFGAGITRGDVVFHRDGNSADLQIGIAGTDDTVTVINQFDAAYTIFGQQWFDRIEFFTFQDGSYYTWDEILEQMVADAKTDGDDTIYGFSYGDVLDGGAGNDFLSGGNENDTYIFGRGYGSDVIHDGMTNILGGKTDTLRFTADVLPQDVTFRRDGATNDLIVTLSSGDTVRVVNQFDGWSSGPFGTLWFDRIERFEFASTGDVLTYEDVMQRILTEAKTPGDDAIYGYFREDVLDGGAGNDYLAGGGEGDTYIWGRGYDNDVVYDMASGIAEGDDIDRVVFSADLAPSDLVFSRPNGGNDVVLTIVDSGETLTVHDQFLKFVIGPEPAQIEEFRFADGTVWTPNDIRLRMIAAEETGGDDTIYGFYVSDRLDGGTGNDHLIGGGGGDTFVFGRGYGHDTIDAYINYVTWDYPDTVEFLAGVAPQDLSLTRIGDDLVISIAGTDDQLKIYGQLGGLGYSRVENFHFADGTTWAWQDVEARLLVGTPGDDVLYGFNNADVLDGGAGNDRLIGRGGGDTYVFDAGYGADVIDAYIEILWYDQPDTVRFGSGLTPSMLELSRVGDDLIVHVAGTTDQLTILAQFQPWGYWRVENFQFADGTHWTWQDVQALLLTGTPGNDILVGYAGPDRLDGGAGNDILRGADDGDTYVFGLGYGHDRIEESVDNHDGADVVAFDDSITPGMLLLAQVGNDLVVTVQGAPDTLTIAGQFAAGGTTDVEFFQFADGTIWSKSNIANRANGGTGENEATAGNDVLVGTDEPEIIGGLAGDDRILAMGGNDRLIGNTGADTLLGGSGSDTYVYTSGDGNDLVREIGGGGDTDVLQLTDLNAGDVTLSRSLVDPNDLVVTVNATGETITVDDHFVDSAHGIEQIHFADGTSMDRAQIAAVAWLQGTPGADTITGTGGDDRIIGNGGDDTLIGGYGHDTYVYASGDGNDVIRDVGNSWETDVLKLANLNLADITLSRSLTDFNDLLITVNSTGQVITIDDHYIDGAHGIDQIQFADGTSMSRSQMTAVAWLRGTAGAETITGTGGDDTIQGRAGADTLVGGYGYDSYVYASGDGNDVISDIGNSWETDVLKLVDVNAAGISVGRSIADPNDYLINITATGEFITIDNYLQGSGIDQIQFADGTTWNRSQIEAVAWIQGTAGADLITGTGGDDRIAGNGGADTLVGGYGWDTYLYAAGDGNDVIRDVGNSWETDVLKLANLNLADITLSRSLTDLNDLLITINSTGQVITIDDHYIDGAHGIDQIQFADGTSMSRSQMTAAAWLRGTAAAETITGTGGDDIIHGRGGADTLVGGYGWDTYVYASGDGNDVISDVGNSWETDVLRLVDVNAAGISVGRSIADPNDYLINITATGEFITIDNYLLGSGIDQIQFSDGTTWNRSQIEAVAWIQGTPGADLITGTGGDDRIAGAGGDDTLVGGFGWDTYRYAAGDGNDIVRDIGNSWDTDVLKLANLNLVDITLSRSLADINDLRVTINSTGQVITVDDQFLDSVHGIEQIQFADGTSMSRSQMAAAAWLRGTAAAETITGTSGDDTFQGNGGADTLVGSYGWDTYVYASGDGNDIVRDAGNSWDSDFLKFTNLNQTDVTLSRSLADINDLLVTINSTGEVINVDDHFLDSAHGIEQMQFADGTSLSRSQIGAGAWLRGTAVAETITGTSGDDTIQGRGGADTLLGSFGFDTYVYASGDGNDIIRDIGNSWETDVLKLTDLNPGDVTLARSMADQNDLLITVNATGQVITVDNHYVNTNSGIEQILFANGTTMDRAAIALVTPSTITGTAGADTLSGDGNPNLLWGLAGNDSLFGRDGNDQLSGDAGNDYLEGGNGNDVYLFNRGDGQDRIYDNGSTGDVDVLRLGSGIAPTDVTAAESTNGADIVLAIAGTTDSITLTSQLTLAWGGIDQLRFADGTTWDRVTLVQRATTATAGNDSFYGDYNNNTLSGGAGNDWMSGRGGDDTYMFGRGYGSDTIDEEGVDSGPSSDRVLFTADVAPGDVTFSRSNTSLVIKINGTTDQMTIADGLWSAINNPGIARDRVEYFDFSDGTRITMNDVQLGLLTGGTGADSIMAYTTDDVLDGKAGNDWMSGRGGNDTYMFGRGYGSDQIDEEGADTGPSSDRVLFAAGVATSDVTFSRSGTSLVAQINGTTDQLTILDGLWSAINNPGIARDRVEYFDFSDGTRINMNDVQLALLTGGAGADSIMGYTTDDVIDAKAGNDWMSGRGGNDTYMFGRGYGSDQIDEEGADTGPSSDRVLFAAGVVAADVTFSRSGTSLVARINGTTDQLTIIDGLWSAINNPGIARDRVEYFDFSDGTRINMNDVQLVLLTGGAGADDILGYTTDDVIDGKAGNDLLSGVSGNDTYLFGLGYGQDVIDENNANGVVGSADRVLFGAGITQGNIHFARSAAGTGNDLVITFDGSTDQLTIRDGLWSDTNNRSLDGDRVEYFDFADGSRLTITTVEAQILVGGSGNETLTGFLSDDVIDGKAGNDLLSGVSGNDTYLFGLGYGQDTIDENNANGVVGSADRVLFGTGITQGNVHFARSSAGTGNDLVITFDGSTDQLTIRDGLWSDTNNRSLDGDRVEYFDFADGSRLTITAIEAQILVGGSANETLTGFLSDDLLDGKDGNDSLFGRDGNDVLIGGAGADVLDGGNGTDTASYATAAAGVTANLTTPASNSGNAAGDTYTSIENLAGSAFADVLTGNTGANVLNGGGGNDTLTGGAGNDTFAFRPGYAIDTITDFSAGAGVADVIELSGFTGVAALADVLSRATQQGADTLIDFGAGDQLLLLNVSKSNLVTDDFRFV